jgi:hypothetical protein
MPVLLSLSISDEIAAVIRAFHLLLKKRSMPLFMKIRMDTHSKK